MCLIKWLLFLIIEIVVALFKIIKEQQKNHVKIDLCCITFYKGRITRILGRLSAKIGIYHGPSEGIKHTHGLNFVILVCRLYVNKKTSR